MVNSFGKNQMNMTRTKLKEKQKQFIKQIQVFHSYFKNINKFIKTTEWKQTDISKKKLNNY